MLKAFHHISLLTKDRTANIAFYTETLGLRLVKNTVNQDNHRMIHLYYGDYQGTPGTVITFFIVPHLGNRYDENHFLATVGFKIPEGSLNYWQERLTAEKIAFTIEGKRLNFADPDGVALYLQETAEVPLPADRQVKNQIPGDKQILGLASSEIHVPDAAATSRFFEKFLDWPTIDGTIQLADQDFLKIIETNNSDKMRMGRGSIDHIALAVEDDATLEQLHKKAQEQNWQIEKIVSRGYFKSLYIREPGGNRIEFATLQPGFTIDEPLESLGESFALPPFLADQRAEIEKNLYQ